MSKQLIDVAEIEAAIDGVLSNKPAITATDVVNQLMTESEQLADPTEYARLREIADIVLARKFDAVIKLADDTMSNAIWGAAWYYVNDLHCSRGRFVAEVTNLAGKAYDAQVNNAGLRADPHYVL